MPSLSYCDICPHIVSLMSNWLIMLYHLKILIAMAFWYHITRNGTIILAFWYHIILSGTIF